MEKIIWTKKYSVGVKEIDTQHKKLLQIINQLIEYQDISVHSEEISDVLTEMMEYASYHFDAEEALMSKHGYAELPPHRRKHMDFIRKTAKLASDTVDGAQQVPQEVLAFLKDWLIDHILKTDMQYKPFFAEKKVF